MSERLPEEEPSAFEDPRPTAELISEFLRRPDSREGRRLLGVLQRRGGREEFEAGKRLARGDSETERIAGADLLGELGWSDRAFVEESVAVLVGLLDDPSDLVVAAAATALGRRNHGSAIPALLPLVRHADAGVRFGVVHGLSGHDDWDAVSGLIELCRDSDADVRDWAAFGLGQLTDLDSEEIRTALLELLEEKDPEIRGEALIGLARRGETRALEPLRRELQGPFHGDWAVEAAGLFADPSLFPLLESLWERAKPEIPSWFEPVFAEALEACRPGE